MRRWWWLVGALSGCAGERVVEAPSSARRPGVLVLGSADGVDERWRDTRGGPAVDWTLPAAGGTVTIPTHALVSVMDEGRWVRLTTLDGRAWTFGPLVAWDGTGAPLEARFGVGEDGVNVEVPGGIGPLRVDPVVRTAPFSAAFAADAVAGVGDLDGDGFDDIAAGAVGGTTTTPGQVSVWMGGSAGPDPAVAVDPTPGGAGWQYGRAVAGDGDLDGDGYADLVVGGDHRAWVHYGAATGVGGRTSRLDDPNGRTGEFGFAVAVAPDLDGDGLDDLLVGDPGYDASRGLVALYPGVSGGTVSSTASLVLEGESAGEWFGVDVDGAGDVNGDGYGDLVVGAHAWNGITGRAYVFHGATTGVATSPVTTLAGVDPLDNFGRAVDGAGDVDQDGYADVVVGAFNGASAYGQGAVYAGSASGVASTPSTVVQGPAYGAKFGNTVAGLGDVDGDGYPDVGMGGHGTTTQAGVHHGGPAGASATPVPRLTGGVTLGKVLDGAGDVDGDGHADLLLADPGAGTVDVHFGGPDLDGDGWILPEDCDDADSGIRGGATVWTDADGDGFGDPTTEAVSCAPESTHVAVAGDCDDTDADVHPDAVERVGDRLDGDCDGVELCYVDGDGDGVLADDAETMAVSTAAGGLDCAVHGLMGADGPWGDCDDTDPEAFPGADETCDGTDRDCDGAVDAPVPEDAPEWRADADGDGYGAGATVRACSAPDDGVAADGLEDCDDTDAAVYPGATDAPDDGIDADCDGEDPTSVGPGPDSGAPVEEPVDDPGGAADKGGCSAVGRPWHAAFWLVLPALVGRLRFAGGERDAEVGAPGA